MSPKKFSPHKILPVLLRLWFYLFLLIGFFSLLDFVSPKEGNSKSIPYIFVLSLLGAFVFFISEKQSLKREKLRNFLCGNFILNSLLVTFSLVFPVTLLELGVRPYCTFVHKDTSIYQKDKELGWKLRPAAKAFHDATIQINSQGLRSPERGYTKPSGIKRILFLGDSITYGLRLEYNDTYPYLSETILKEKNRLPAECINAGIPGYSTWQEYLFWLKEGVKYQPDIVVLSFCLNDVLNTYTGIRFGDYGQDDPVPYIEDNWMDSLLKRSAIIYMGKHYYYKIRYGKNMRENAIYREGLDAASLYEKANTPEIQHAWELTHTYIKKIAEETKQRNARFLFVIFPYNISLPGQGIQPWMPKTLLEFSAQNNIPVLDMLPVFQKDMDTMKNHELTRYFRDACHPTAYGSHLAAQAIADEIIQRQWIQ